MCTNNKAPEGKLFRRDFLASSTATPIALFMVGCEKPDAVSIRQDYPKSPTFPLANPDKFRDWIPMECRKVFDHVPSNLSAAIHMLQIPEYVDSAKPFSAITDETTAMDCFGSSPFVETRYGLRYRLARTSDVTGSEDRSCEAHRDQCLHALARKRVSLDTPIALRSGMYNVNDILAESVASFELTQRELCWTAFAYAVYLPPLRTWKTKHGDEHNFDELVFKLVSSNLHLQSCSGAHVLEALKCIEVMDNQFEILSSRGRRSVCTYLAKMQKQICTKQRTSGNWIYNWSKEGEQGELDLSVEQSMVATGHLVSYLCCIAETEGVPRNVC